MTAIMYWQILLKCLTWRIKQNQRSTIGSGIRFFRCPFRFHRSRPVSCYLRLSESHHFFIAFFVIGAILFGVHFAAKAFDAEFVGNLLICVALAGVFLPLLYRTLFAVRMGAGKMKIRLLSSLLLVFALLGLVVLFVRVPIPFPKKAPVVVESARSNIDFCPAEWTTFVGRCPRVTRFAGEIPSP